MSALDVTAVQAGDALPELDVKLDATKIVAGAIASRDFMPVHHDRDYAQGQGAPDLFLNILSTNGYIARYLTDWAGPRSELRNIRIRLGVPAIPGHVLQFRGNVSEVRDEEGARTIAVELKATNEMGDHATGTAELRIPV